MKEVADKEYFKIGEITRLFGVGPDSIRYYEKMGLISPTRDENSNYRLYSLEDIRQIMVVRELLSLEFSTEEIRGFVKERTVEHTLAQLEKELGTVNETLLRLYQTKESLQNRIEAIRKAKSLNADRTVRMLELEARPCVMISATWTPDNKVAYSAIQRMHTYQQKLNVIGACECYTLDLEHSDPKSSYYRTYNVFLQYPGCAAQSDYVLPAGQYLTLTYRGPMTLTKKLMPRLFEYAAIHKLKVIGRPIELDWITAYETENEEEFVVEIQLPVQKQRNKNNVCL